MVGVQYVSLTAGELSAAIVAGVLDVSGSFYCDTWPDTGDFYVFKGSSADGELSLRYDARNRQLHLTVRGVIVASTTALGSNPAAPTLQNWVPGQTVTWRVWYDPAGGARSIGIRWAVDVYVGNDTTGTGSGVALAALDSAIAACAADGSWAATTSILSGSKAANVACRGVVIGDSICAPRLDLPALATFLGARSTGAVATLAQGGATVAGQTTTWQASRHRGDAGVAWVVIQVGINDVNASTASATILSNLQTLVNDINTNNPGAVVVICQMLPAKFYLSSSAKQTIWSDVNTGINGGGATPITGADAVVTGNVTATDDGQGNLHYHLDSLHTTLTGRRRNATPIASALSSLGVL